MCVSGKVSCVDIFIHEEQWSSGTCLPQHRKLFVRHFHHEDLLYLGAYTWESTQQVVDIGSYIRGCLFCVGSYY